MAELFRPETSAMILIDHQVGTLQMVKTAPVADVMKKTIALAQAAKILEMPVVLTTSVETSFQQPLIKDLAEALPDDYPRRIKRMGIVNAWDDPEFKAAVEATGRKQLIMAAVTTDICLIFPALSAARDGYQVQAVIDASGSPSDLSEELARTRMHDAGIVLTTANTLIAELARDWSTPAGGQLAHIMVSSLNPTVHMLDRSEGAPI